MSAPHELGAIDWVKAIGESPLDLPPGTDHGELHHHIRLIAQERFGGTGWRASAHQPHFSYAAQPTGCDIHSQLLMARAADGVHFFAAGARGAEGDVETWEAVLEEARRRLGVSELEFEWSGIVGPDPDDLLAQPPTFARFQVGELLVRPSSEPLREWREQRTSLNSRSGSITRPVIVDGRSSGYSWPSAQVAAGAQLRQLAAVLSVVSGHPWRTRSQPNEAERGTVDLVDSPGWDPHPPEGEAEGAVLEAPGWLNDAWTTLHTDDILRTALLAHHEGLLLEQHHPSFAVVAHIAALDGLGRKFAAGGNRERVEAAVLESGRDPQELSLVLEAYASRCSTVHEGGLHGTELVDAMVWTPTFFEIDVVSDFLWNTLRRVRSAARVAVQHVLLLP